MTFTYFAAAASSTSSPGQGSSGLRMTIAQSIESPKRSKHSMTSSVKPLAGPGADPEQSGQPGAGTASRASHSRGSV